MKYYLLILFIVTSAIYSSKNPKVIYTYPAEGSKTAGINPTVLFRLDNKVNLHELSAELTGQTSGVHKGILNYHKNSYVFNFSSSLFQDEKITAEIFVGSKKIHEWVFFAGIHSPYYRENEKNENVYRYEEYKSYAGPKFINDVAVPTDFPDLNTDVLKTGVSTDKIFITNQSGVPYLMVFNYDGSPYFYRKVSDYSRDFKVHPNGKITYYQFHPYYKYFGMDSTLTITDTFSVSGNLASDAHEFQMFEDGGYALIGLGSRIIDMSQVVPDGDDKAKLIDVIVEEYDPEKNLIFSWNTENYFEVTDATYEDLTADVIDYVHMNSIAVDYDNNFVFSSRNLSEVTKVNRTTGEIIWRLGGENNQFIFSNDDFGISYQHDARPVPGKPDHYTIFDNGTYHNPQFSRAIEFRIDTANIIAEKVWEYKTPNEDYAHWMGNAQRLDNGNTLINFVEPELPKAVEVTEAGEVVYQANFETEDITYRTFKFNWEAKLTKPYLVGESFPEAVLLTFNHFGKENIEKYIIYSSINVGDLAPFDTVYSSYAEYDTLQNKRYHYFAVSSVNSSGEESELSNTVRVTVNYFDIGANYITNGDFAEGRIGWKLELDDMSFADWDFTDGELYLDIQNAGHITNSVMVTQKGIPLIFGRVYKFSFDAKADDTRIANVMLRKELAPYTNYSKSAEIVLKRQWKTFEYEFTMTENTDHNSKLVFELGGSTDNVSIDNVFVTEVVTDVAEDKVLYVNEFQLSQNYPNPFNPETTISFSLPDAGLTNMTVYNMLGEKVAELVNNDLSAGNHTISFNGEALSSGVYFYKLTQNNSSLTKKMLLLK